MYRSCSSPIRCQRLALAASLLTLAACADEPSQFMRELTALSDELNREAQRACAATDDDVRAAEREGVEAGPVAACVTELRVGFDRCEREGLDKQPDDARRYLECTRRDHRQLVACCTAEGACSYDAIEECYQTLWEGESRGECDVDMAAIEAAIDACRARTEAEWTFRDPCEGASFRSIAFDASTEFGSPSEVLAPYAGSCSARYRFAPVGSSNTTDPAMAAGDIEIAFEFDQNSARLVTPSADGAKRGCSPHVEVRMTATVKTSDGLLDERARGVVSFDEGGLTPPSNLQASSSEDAFALRIAEEDIAGTVGLTSSQSGKLSLGIAPRPLSVACEGKFWVHRDDTGGGGSSLAGWWSASGCWPGYEPNTCNREP